MHKVIYALLALVSLSFVPSYVQAQTYPDKPIKLIVPWPPGGGADVVSRLLSKAVGDDRHQTAIRSFLLIRAHILLIDICIRRCLLKKVTLRRLCL